MDNPQTEPNLKEKPEFVNQTESIKQTLTNVVALVENVSANNNNNNNINTNNSNKIQDHTKANHTSSLTTTTSSTTTKSSTSLSTSNLKTTTISKSISNLTKINSSSVTKINNNKTEQKVEAVTTSLSLSTTAAKATMHSSHQTLTTTTIDTKNNHTKPPVKTTSHLILQADLNQQPKKIIQSTQDFSKLTQDNNANSSQNDVAAQPLLDMMIINKSETKSNQNLPGILLNKAVALTKIHHSESHSNLLVFKEANNNKNTISTTTIASNQTENKLLIQNNTNKNNSNNTTKLTASSHNLSTSGSSNANRLGIIGSKLDNQQKIISASIAQISVAKTEQTISNSTTPQPKLPSTSNLTNDASTLPPALKSSLSNISQNSSSSQTTQTSTISSDKKKESNVIVLAESSINTIDIKAQINKEEVKTVVDNKFENNSIKVEVKAEKQEILIQSISSESIPNQKPIEQRPPEKKIEEILVPKAAPVQPDQILHIEQQTIKTEVSTTITSINPASTTLDVSKAEIGKNVIGHSVSNENEPQITTAKTTTISSSTSVVCSETLSAESSDNLVVVSIFNLSLRIFCS
jgi:hypothetical protein